METTNKSDSLQRPEGRGFSPTLLMKREGKPVICLNCIVKSKRNRNQALDWIEYFNEKRLIQQS